MILRLCTYISISVRDDSNFLYVGQEIGQRPEDKAQLAHPIRVKEMNVGVGVPTWSKRFTVLCGSRMFVFPGSRPKAKPNLVLDLRGGRIEEHKSKKHFYCLKVTASHREVRLAFETGLEQSRWLERAAKVKVMMALGLLLKWP